MNESRFQQPTDEQLSHFVKGDPLAIDTVIRLILPQLYNWGKRAYPYISEQEVKSTIHDVLGETCLHHERYNPGQAKFTT